MQNYKVFCGECKRGYEQAGYKPFCCGMCGSDFIAVKAINVSDALGLDDEPMHGAPAHEPAPMYDA